MKITLSAALTAEVLDAAEETPSFCFGVIADPQYADVDPMGSRHYRKSIGKLRTAIQDLNKHDLHFVATLGDIIDRNFESFDDIMPLYEDLKAPRRFVMGNHDFAVAEADKSKVQDRLGMKSAYYSETFQGWHFIYLDGTDVSTYRYGKESSLTANALTTRKEIAADQERRVPIYGGAVGGKQLEWFSMELQRAKDEKKRVIVFSHFPAFPLRDSYNLWNDQEVVGLIAKHSHVVAYMNGHRHKGHYDVNGGCHYMNFKGMVETIDKSAYAVVRCYSDRLEIEGYETEADRTCEFS